MFAGHFCPPDPDTDPGTPLNRDPIRIRSRIRIHSTPYILRIVCCVTRTSWRCWRYRWCRCRSCCPGEYPGSPADPAPWMSISRQVPCFLFFFLTSEPQKIRGEEKFHKFGNYFILNRNQGSGSTSLWCESGSCLLLLCGFGSGSYLSLRCGSGSLDQGPSFRIKA